MSAQPESKTDRILDQIRNLIAKIEHPNTPEAERDMCQERADRLMFRYAIDEATIAKAQAAGVREKPSSARVVITGRWNNYRRPLAQILDALAKANRCRVMTLIDSKDNTYIGHVVGFDADVRFVEMMYTSVHLQFVGKVDPKWDGSRTDSENVRVLKEAGWKWTQIEAAADNAAVQWPENADTRSRHGMLMRLYKAQCKIDGVEPMATQRHTAYRISFATAFFNRLLGRLSAMSQSRKEAVQDYEKETGARGTDLVLSSRLDEVNEAFYAFYPEQRPMTAEERADALAAQRAREAAEIAQREAFLAALSQAKREAFLRREARDAEAQDRRDQRTYDRWNREDNQNAQRTYDSHGVSAGRRAADNVDLTGGRGGVGPAPRKGIR